jgi:hypothetical protein
MKNLASASRFTGAGAVAIDEFGAALLDTFDRQRQVDTAARLVARHLTMGSPPEALIATLAHALLREARFHAYQMLEGKTALGGGLRIVGLQRQPS